MPKDTMFVIPPKETRQAQIEAMEVGDTIALSRRVSLLMGITEDTIGEHNHQIRGILDQQASRARRRVAGAQYIVENGAFVSRSGALLLTAALTRIA